MAYHWQRHDGEHWVPVPAASLPATVRSKKSVLFAHAGKVMESVTADGRTERFRLVKAPADATPPASQQGTPGRR